MPDEGDVGLFEASLMLLAGVTTPRDTNRRVEQDPWAALGTELRLTVEFETEPAATRFTDLMQAVPDASCWTRRRVTGIRRRYETFVVEVDGVEPSTVVGYLRDEWTCSAGLLLGSGPVKDAALRVRAAAVWRSALLTAAPRASSSGLRLRERHRSSVRLLVRAAQVLGVTCQVRPANGVQTICVTGRGVITLLSTIRLGSGSEEA
ncbi:hypothetical protein KZZ52_15390 [Dactylosporangium sp. AC04546]|uniref:hypothetical protein n=1 Tax=Dactylosporangium sp. AC04546 TaxID=2862460 RepID=UPI001EE09CA5|nr:hypothetical protein [Dactylosporangium sp. AC04546]WVK86690.1 hypothetical protein KZZ52_15390 [Dactylosporangium sp. AC04546]